MTSLDNDPKSSPANSLAATTFLSVNLTVNPTSSSKPYDSFLLVSFGGPEGPDEVIPFLENVLRGRNVPRERMLEVAQHYQRYGGVSPINQQNRELIAALSEEFANRGLQLPIYWGNRNWRPMLADTLRQMRDDGCQHTLAFFTSMFSSYSGCRQYRENIIDACQEVGAGAPQVDKLRFAFNHPGFVLPMAENTRQAIAKVNADPSRTPVLFTAHSIPISMADSCSYVRQLTEASRLVAEAAGVARWELVYQSRSGPPQQPWLEPDICDHLKKRDEAQHLDKVVIVPIGFVSDHMEVIYDLDEEAAEVCKSRGIEMARAATVGRHPEFVRMIPELVEERIRGGGERKALGHLGPWHDVCPVDCCPPPVRQSRRA